MSDSSRTVAADPEVLIDPREGAALERLLAGIRGGRVNLVSLARASAPTVATNENLPPLPEIVIPLLPLTPAPGEGERR